MNLSPLTLFLLAFLVGALGGLWSVMSADGEMRPKDYVGGILGGSLVGTALSLLLYEKLGVTEFGQCTLLGLSLILSMAGKVGFQKILAAAARLYLGQVDGGETRRDTWRNDASRTTNANRADDRDDNQKPGNQKVGWP